MAFKHNKKRNSGLVYEFLVRRLGSQLVEQDKEGANHTVEITERYFSDGEPLANELELFRAIRDTRGVSQTTARRVLGEVARQARMQDAKKLDVKKSNLIKELNYTFGRDFFDKHRLPEYRLLASIQLYIDSHRGKRLAENFQAIQLEDGMVKWMTSTPVKPEKDIEEKVDDLVCTMASKRFNEKYGNSLNAGQKSLLETYVGSLVTEHNEDLLKKVNEDKNRIAKLLVGSYKMKEVQEDKVMKQRYVEAAKKLASLDVSRADENVIEEMMLFHKLAEELSSNE
jgi:hypothetical protein